MMKSFREIIAEFLETHPDKKTITDEGIDRWLAQNADKMIKKFAGLLARNLDGGQEAFVEDIHSDRAGFQKRLFETWRAPLTRLDSLVAMCIEIGNEINVEYRSSDKFPRSSRRSITIRLHTRALQIANEVLCLLRGGFADGAMARWRSLHETTVILAFLCRHDDALSSRFLDFQAIIRVKAATEYNDHSDALGFQSFNQARIKEFRDEYDSVLTKYGKKFASDYGWALGVLEQKRITFKDIEKFVGMDHLRPQYGFASKNIHSGVDSVGYKLALSMADQDSLLAGPSNAGLVDPIQCTSYSLICATSELIGTAPHDERSIMESVLWWWHKRLKQELVKADAALRQRINSSSN